MIYSYFVLLKFPNTPNCSEKIFSTASGVGLKNSNNAINCYGNKGGGAKMWKEYLKRLEPLPFRVENCEVINIPRFGVSGAGVVIFRDLASGEKYVLKYGVPTLNPVHSIKSQVSNRAILANLFGEHHLPDVPVHNEDTMLMPCLDGETMQEAVQRKSMALDTVLRFHERVLNHVREGWNKSAVPYDPKVVLARNPQERVVRVLQATMGLSVDGIALEDAMDFEVIVNEQTLGSLETILKKLQAYSPPAELVRCHGDITGENIIIDTKTNQWWIIDWEWTGWHDWRVAASFMSARWLSICSSVKNVKVKTNGRLELSYELAADEAARLITKATNRLVETIGKVSGEADWERQFKLQEAILLLGDARFVRQRNCADHLVPLIGESFRILTML